MTSSSPKLLNLLGQLLPSADVRHLESDAIIAGDRVISYSQLHQQIHTIAGWLRRRGVQHGDRVGLILGNTPEYVAAFFAVAAVGGISVSIEARSGMERLKLILDETSPVLCLTTLSGQYSQPVAVTSELLVLDPENTRVLINDQPLQVSAEDDIAETLADDPVLILFSAGSTGRPKGVRLSHRNLFRIARTVSGVVGMDADHHDLILSPLTHSGGWQRVTGTLLSRGTVVFPQGMFSVPTLLEDVEKHAINGFFTTPPFIRMLLNTPRERFEGRVPTLKSIEIASAPLTASELAELLEVFPHANVFFQYGSTECSRALILDTRGRPDRLGTVGLPTPEVEVSIIGADGQGQPVGEDGEVYLRAPQLTRGYWNRPELDVERFRDGWIMTGDYGRLDEEGFLTLLGRKDDMINCGGHSFFPAEVEIELGKIEGVSSFLVAGVPDPAGILTEVPWLFAVVEQPENWSTADLLRDLRGKLPSHMLPRNVVLIDELPLTESGKPSRRRTVELHGPKVVPQGTVDG